VLHEAIASECQVADNLSISNTVNLCFAVP